MQAPTKLEWEEPTIEVIEAAKVTAGGLGDDDEDFNSGPTTS